VEIKYRMNWLKAGQAEWEFRRFIKRINRRPFPVDGGIVFFEQFSGDWKRRAGRRFFENGWSHWYRGHAEVEGLRVDLLRLHDGVLDGFPVVTGQMCTPGELDSHESEKTLEHDSVVKIERLN
jgi:hypothetical protein